MDGKILVVDDELEMCFMVSNLLQHHGYDVVTAENADVALSHADAYALGLIILDANLAGEDGFKLMTYLKQNHPDVPIIVYTGMSHDEDTVQRVLAMGAGQYLRKGAPVDELISAVKAALPA
jgi:DNA-binding response OmpR family regulator